MPSLPVMAVILVPLVGPIAQYVDACYRHCRRFGYHVIGVIPVDDRNTTAKVLRCQPNVLVIARSEHRPADWPRIEVAGTADEPTELSRGPVRRRRRPHRIEP